MSERAKGLRIALCAASNSKWTASADDLAALLREAEQLPAKSAGKTLRMNSLKELKFVNRTAADQTLNFSPKGMTVIYGGKGSANSGYSRVLRTVRPTCLRASLTKADRCRKCCDIILNECVV